MSNVNNGTATITVNTTDYTCGKYKVKTTYPQNNYYNSSTTQSSLTLTKQTVITDDCTTNTNWYPSRFGLPTITTMGGYTCLNGVPNTNEHSIHKQMCIYRYSNSTLEFDINLASNYGIFGLASLELLSNGKLNKNVLQYVPYWNRYGNESGRSTSSGSISKNTWHHIRWETENQTTKCYTDDTLTWTTNWQDYSTVTEFNDYWFLFLQRIYATDNVYMKNIRLTSDHLVQGSELERVLARYEAQYTGGGVISLSTTLTSGVMT